MTGDVCFRGRYRHPIPRTSRRLCRDWSPCTIASIESAISSRENRENFILSWFMLMPSETETVVNSLGVPPAVAIPALMRSCDREQPPCGFENQVVVARNFDMSKKDNIDRVWDIIEKVSVCMLTAIRRWTACATARRKA